VPREVLDHILSHFAQDYKTLRNFSLVSRYFWEVATSILYSNIDINFSIEATSSIWKLQETGKHILRTLASYV
jgi:hypothetical protein